MEACTAAPTCAGGSLFFFGPIVITAFIIGLNPGFLNDGLAHSTLSLLWIFYGGLHLLWLIILLLEPAVLSAQEAGEAQENRVNKIKAGAADRE